jgi:hypothetical protein
MQKSVATLRISGDDLIPDEISSRLGCAPSKARQKAELIVGKKTGTTTVARTGMWSLYSTEREPEDLEIQIEELLANVTSDIAVWRDLVHRYRVDLFCGLFMGSKNDGLTLSPKVLVALGQRGIMLALDIYDRD